MFLDRMGPSLAFVTMRRFPTVDNVRIVAFFVARMELVSFLHLNRCFPAPDISDRVGFETDIFIFNFVAKLDFEEK